MKALRLAALLRGRQVAVPECGHAPRPTRPPPSTERRRPEPRTTPAREVRLAVLVGFPLTYLALHLLRGALWGRGREPGNLYEEALVWASILWALPVVGAVIGLIGMLSYRTPACASPGPPIRQTVAFRIVSRGQNADALRSTVERIRLEMARRPLFPYLIEVVTDVPVEIPAGTDLMNHLVPPEYQTPCRSAFKARALQFALETSPIGPGVWLMHLDEESHISPSLIDGIRDAVRDEESSGRHRIGQGCILYHRSFREHPFLTLADSIRTGDDVGRFYFQHRLGFTLFGLHGSFILVRNSVEKEVGFDFGPTGSITEDAFWALVQMQNGRRCRWVHGHMVEQSTESVMDFVKQRRRWFVGLAVVVLRAPTRIRYRAALGVSTFLWSISWFGILYTYVNLVTGLRTPEPIVILGTIAYASYVLQYSVGLKMNLDHYGHAGTLRRSCLYVLQIVLIPVFSLMEGAGVLYGVLRPNMSFHVVKK